MRVAFLRQYIETHTYADGFRAGLMVALIGAIVLDAAIFYLALGVCRG